MAFRKKVANFVNSKGGKATVIGTVAFIVLGLLALFIAFVIKDGIESVLKWFGSEWAIRMYIGLAFCAFGILWLILWSKRYEE